MNSLLGLPEEKDYMAGVAWKKKDKVVILLTGLPGSGKTTWTSKFLGSHPDFISLSTDAIFEEYAEKNGKTYSEAFKDLKFSSVEQEFYGRMSLALFEGKNIVWDQTNLTEASRTTKLNRIPPGYKVYSVFFEVSEEVLEKRLASRPGKDIPKYVVDTMRKIYVRPENTEGFDAIIGPIGE